MNLEKEVFDIVLNDIMPNRFQPREIFDETALKELAGSIKEHGVIQPIIVRKVGDKYEIIAGERRFRASKLAGKETIPALIKNMDDKEAAKVALLENLQRKDLTPIEEAKTYQTILKLDNLTQDELAVSLGKSQSTIANKLRLLNLDDTVQKALLNGKISERHARSLLNLDNKEQQKSVLEQVINNRLTVKQLDEQISVLTGKAVISEDEVGENINYINTPQQVIPTATPQVIEPVTDVPNQQKYDFGTVKPIDISPVMGQINSQSITPVQSPVADKAEQITSIPVIIPNGSFVENNSIGKTPEFSEIKTQPIISNITLPTDIPVSDNSKDFDMFDQIESLISEKPLTQNSEQTVPLVAAQKSEEPQSLGNIYDLRFAINNVRQAVQNTKKFGFEIDVEEFDFENIYQIIIKIDKNK